MIYFLLFQIIWIIQRGCPFGKEGSLVHHFLQTFQILFIAERTNRYKNYFAKGTVRQHIFLETNVIKKWASLLQKGCSGTIFVFANNPDGRTCCKEDGLLHQLILQIIYPYRYWFLVWDNSGLSHETVSILPCQKCEGSTSFSSPFLSGSCIISIFISIFSIIITLHRQHIYHHHPHQHIQHHHLASSSSSSSPSSSPSFCIISIFMPTSDGGIHGGRVRGIGSLFGNCRLNHTLLLWNHSLPWRPNSDWPCKRVRNPSMLTLVRYIGRIDV